MQGHISLESTFHCADNDLPVPDPGEPAPFPSPCKEPMGVAGSVDHHVHALRGFLYVCKNRRWNLRPGYPALQVHVPRCRAADSAPSLATPWVSCCLIRPSNVNAGNPSTPTRLVEYAGQEREHTFQWCFSPALLGPRVDSSPHQPIPSRPRTPRVLRIGYRVTGKPEVTRSHRRCFAALNMTARWVLFD